MTDDQRSLLPDCRNEEMWTLCSAMCDGTIDEQQLARLEQFAEDDSSNRLFCAMYMRMNGQLMRTFRPTNIKGKAANEWIDDGNEDSPDKDPCLPASVDLLANLPARPFIPALGLFGDTVHGTLHFLSQEAPIGFLVATIILAIGLWIGSMITVNYDAPVAVRPDRPESRSETTPGSDDVNSKDVDSTDFGVNSDNGARFVGRITDAVNCQWKVQAAGTKNRKAEKRKQNSLVALGDEFILTSGLMELVYDTGARVILQGPCTYTVESTAGGFLAVGKLTTKLEKDLKSQITNQQTSNPQSLIPNPLFFVRTPTAVVTDLGTEFGVEVNPKGHTTSHVFRGLVELRTIATDGNRKGDIQLLHANQSARVEEIAENTGGNQNKNQNQPQSGRRRIVLLASSATSSDFVREIPKFKIKMFDLVDVVAGGNGFSGKRGAGIDPTNGLPCNTVEFGDNPATVIIYPTGDRKYHRVKWQPFIDGVFIPDGSRGPFQVDSARHMFIDCPTTKNQTAYHLWAGGVIPTVRTTVPTKLNGVDYASNGHGLLFMLANDGITFDLNAIRKANPGWTIGKFLTVVGNVQDRSVADFWVLVDGEVRDRRRQCDASNGAFSVAIPIKSDDRFLTLISTDGGDNILRDFIIFGDPRLELMCPSDVNTVALPDQRE